MSCSDPKTIPLYIRKVIENNKPIYNIAKSSHKTLLVLKYEIKLSQQSRIISKIIFFFNSPGFIYISILL